MKPFHKLGKLPAAHAVAGRNRSYFEKYAQIGLLLAMASAAVTFFVVNVMHTQHMAHAYVNRSAARETRLADTFQQALRDYVAEAIRPEMIKRIEDDGFVPEAMSTSYVARSVFEKVRKDFPELMTHFASRNPRNPVNQATPAEIGIIRYFEQHPHAVSWSGVVSLDDSGEEHFVRAFPRRMRESCLRCHGDPEDAPDTLVDRYGAQAGFGMSVGDVSIDLAAIPVSAAYASAEALTRRHVLVSGAACLLFLLGMIALFYLHHSYQRHSKLQLEEQREWLGATLHSINDAVVSTDEAGRVVDMNLVAESIFDLPLSEASGKPLGARLRIVNPMTGEAVSNPVDHALARGESVGLIHDVALLTPTGTEKPISVSAAPIRNADGKVHGAVLVIRDITELETLNRSLQEQTNRAEMANTAKSEFLANVSHEIRTPMTAILGFADVIKEGCPADCGFGGAEHREHTDTIIRNGNHLLQLINDILDLSRIESGSWQIEHAVCSPMQILMDVESLMRVRSVAKGLELKVHIEGSIPETIKTDPTRLRQILINLAGNAVKFTEEGRVTIIARLAHSSEGAPMLEFDIVDTGIGMTEEQVKKLFRPFSQADYSTTRVFGGTGLGLTISRRLAASLNGDVTVVRSSPGSGSCFRATIALETLENVRMITGPSMGNCIRPDKRSQAVQQQSLSACHILLAEDGLDNQRLIGHLLKKAGAEVTVVENGALAVDAVLAAQRKECPFDAVLMDMQMPVMDGYTATMALRHNGYDSPIIALTAHAMATDRQKCLDAGCSEYLTKPVNRPTLVKALRQQGVGISPSVSFVDGIGNA